jgi:hypothetical protein
MWTHLKGKSLKRLYRWKQLINSKILMGIILHMVIVLYVEGYIGISATWGIIAITVGKDWRLSVMAKAILVENGLVVKVK